MGDGDRIGSQTFRHGILLGLGDDRTLRVPLFSSGGDRGLLSIAAVTFPAGNKEQGCGENDKATAGRSMPESATLGGAEDLHAAEYEVA